MKPRAPKKTAARTSRTASAAPRSQPRAEAKPTPRPGALQIKEILVPTDFSPPADKAVKYALAFCRQFGARLTLAYVVEPKAFSDFQAKSGRFEDESSRKAARDKLASIRNKQADIEQFMREPKVVVGKPFQEIVSMARGLKVDLVILGTHGRTGLRHVLLGSVAEKVLRHAPCPVLVVREKEHEFV